MDPSEPSAPEETIVRNGLYSIRRARANDVLVIRIVGRYDDSLLDDLRDKVFTAKADYAVDASDLTGMTAAFARELIDTADSLKSGERRLVLLRPPETLRSMISLHGARSAVEIVRSEEQLLGGAGGGGSSAHTLRELERLEREFRSNRQWQFVDREGCWICPFCARVQEDVRVASPLSVGASTVEKAYRHLWSKCPDFKPTSARPRPLAELQEALRRANEEKVVVPRRQMVKIESQMAALKDKAEELEESIRKASERQRRLLPAKAPEVEGCEIDLIYRPAEEVSGDFYDFVPLRGGKVAFLIGDVSGHGIAAGVVMGMAKKVLSLRLQDAQHPVGALVRTNADVDRDLGRVSFVTAFIAVFDPSTRKLTCARAGHNPPLLFNRARKNPCLELSPGGMGLGIMDQPAFEESVECLEMTVLPGDVLLLYTDGLTEARDEKGEQFGVARTIEVLASTFGYPPPLVLSTLSGALDFFTKGCVSDDDITAVCLRFR